MEGADPYANIVSMDELEGKNGRKSTRTPPVKDQATPTEENVKPNDEKPAVSGSMTPPSSEKAQQPPGGLPTPPSEGTPSETSPNSSAPAAPAVTSPPTPIKLKIRRSLEQGGLSHLTSIPVENDTTVPDAAPLAAVPLSPPVARRGRPRKHSAPAAILPVVAAKLDPPHGTVEPPIHQTKTKAFLKGQKLKKQTEKQAAARAAAAANAAAAAAAGATSANLGGHTPTTAGKPTEAIKAEVKPVSAASKSKVDLNNLQGHTPKFLVGDLVWAKVSGHAWWPCMMTYDPLLGIYVRGAGKCMKCCIFYKAKGCFFFVGLKITLVLDASS